jgi:hypothetical protein
MRRLTNTDRARSHSPPSVPITSHRSTQLLGCESDEAGPTEYNAALTGNPSACEASGTLKKR